MCATVAQQPTTPDKDAEFRTTMNRGGALLRDGKLAEALAVFQHASELNPDDVRIWASMADVYLKLGENEKALDLATRILQANRLTPSFVARGHVLRGQALVAIGDKDQDAARYPEAEREFRAALELFPQVPSGHFFVGDVLMKEHREAEGLAELRQFLLQLPAGRETSGFARIAQSYLQRHANDARGQPSPPEEQLDEHLYQARLALRAGKYDDAVKEFKRAAKIRPDNADPYVGLAETYRKLGAHKDAVEAARHALGLTSDRAVQVNAHNLAGVALVDLGDNNPDPRKYQEAEQEFRAAIALVPEAAISHFNLGTALLKQGRDADGSAELNRCLELGPSENIAKQARTLLDNPRRARESFAPEFSLTTLQGEYISLDELQGKVVLLDFWATWCSPCRESVGDLKHFAKKFANDPVMVISVSADRDEQAWRKFVAEKKMDWPQYWDANGRITRLFNVRAFPTYLVLDAEGIVHRAVVGGGVFNSMAIESEIKRCLKAMPPKERNVGRK